MEKELFLQVRWLLGAGKDLLVSRTAALHQMCPPLKFDLKCQAVNFKGFARTAFMARLHSAQAKETAMQTSWTL